MLLEYVELEEKEKVLMINFIIRMQLKMVVLLVVMVIIVVVMLIIVLITTINPPLSPMGSYLFFIFFEWGVYLRGGLIRGGDKLSETCQYKFNF